MATDNAQRVGGLSQKDARQQRAKIGPFPSPSWTGAPCRFGVGCDPSTRGTTEALGIPVSGILKLSLFLTAGKL